MQWNEVPSGPIVTSALALIGFIGWLVRLEMRANGTAKDFADHEKDQAEDVKQSRSDEKDRAAGYKGVTDALHQGIALTNTRITLIEHNITEIKATAVTRHDLKDLKRVDGKHQRGRRSHGRRGRANGEGRRCRQR